MKLMLLLVVLAYAKLAFFVAAFVKVETILLVIGALVGLPALWAAIIDLLKFAGVVTDGTAGKWNAAFNLLTLVLVVVALNFFPALNIPAIDEKLLEIAKLVGLVLVYVAQIFESKGVHALITKVVPKASFSNK